MTNDDTMRRYGDIIDLPHPEPKGRPRMSAQDRAAQFSPFAALTGYGAAIAETGRLTQARAELDEYEAAAINDALTRVAERIAQRPVVTITRFVPDERKAGGAYVTKTDAVVKIKAYERALTLASGETVPFADIVEIGLVDVANEEQTPV